MKQLKILLASLSMLFTTLMTAQGVGIGTNTPKATLHVAEHKTVLFGKDTTGAGGKLMWLPSKYCFRAGVTGPMYGVGGGEYDYGNSAIWDYDSLGFFSFAGGFNNLALGNSSVALGGYNQARGEFSVALGNANKAIGNYVEASGNSSLATGYLTKASGFSAVSTGHYTEAPGYFSFAGGSESKALGEYSIAIGHTNIATGKNTIALGASSKANADIATSMGQETMANALNSFVIDGYNDTIAGSNLNSWVTSDPR